MNTILVLIKLMDYSGAVLEIPRLPDPQPQNRALGSYLTHPPDSTHGRTIPSKGLAGVSGRLPLASHVIQ